MSLVNYPEYLKKSLEMGSKHSIIHVKNLSANARVGVDVWGREENGKVNKFQPVQISASIALNEPFKTAATSDSVDESTVHYGILSKEILKVLAFRAESPKSHNDGEKPEVIHTIEADWSLTVLLDAIFSWLTHEPLQNCDAAEVKSLGWSETQYSTLLRMAMDCKKTVVNMSSIQELKLSCFLPKGSILGSGVSLRLLTIPDQTVSDSLTFCSILKLHDIRIPTLIGVNANERLAKQMVIANIEIDGYMVYYGDLYHKLEQVVVKVCTIPPNFCKH